MPLKVYISYGTSDLKFVDSLYSILKQSGYEVLTNWHEYYEPNEDMFESIKTKIAWSDVTMFFISEKDAIKKYLFQEITIARTLEKIIIPIIESNAEIPWDLKKYPYIIFDKDDPVNTLKNIYTYTNEIKKKKDVDTTLGLIFLSGAIILLATALSDEKSEVEK